MPNHIGIIMDGNRRWAKKRLMPAPFGHKAGADNVENIVEAAGELGINHISLWALSTDNYKKRSKEELSTLFDLMKSIQKRLNKMVEKGLKVSFIGDLSKLPDDVLCVFEDIQNTTKDNTSTHLTLAINYGGKDEIIRGIKSFISNGGDINSLDEDSFRSYLDTKDLPKLDLMIRTGGNKRTSGYFMYDSDYSELYFTDVLWPDFSKSDLKDAIEYFEKCKRNFGK